VTVPATLELPPALDPLGLRAVFLDLDGTLLDAGRPLPGAAEAIARLQATGVRALIATGRMLTSTVRLAAALGVDGPLVCYQGALVQEAGQDEPWAYQPLLPQTARALIVAVQDAGHALHAFRDEAVWVEAESDHALQYVFQNEVPLHVVPDLVAWADQPVTKLIVTGPPESLDALRDRLEPEFGDRAFIAKSLPHYLELAAPGVSKAAGMAVVAERLGFTADRTAAFGDGENDLEMLDWAGFGVAVGGGFPALLERADWICPPLVEGGVPAALHAIAAAREAAPERSSQ
jgi:Cof subfamily protein (haloacid dehalogenase superfamily)